MVATEVISNKLLKNILHILFFCVFNNIILSQAVFISHRNNREIIITDAVGDLILSKIIVSVLKQLFNLINN